MASGEYSLFNEGLFSVRPATSIVVPTFNERHNIATLLDRLVLVLGSSPSEVLFVDDSDDDTPAVIAAEAASRNLPVVVVHREPGRRTGGLAGAVIIGIGRARGEYVVVMDGDLQHPPELVPVLLDTAVTGALDLVAASRYCGQGDAGGLSNQWRRSVSGVSTLLARGLFPHRVGAVCTDPMTGFFCVRRAAVDPAALRPRGFKILLEILASHDLRVGEVPFTFGERHAGDSKASWRNGLHFITQLLSLRLATRPARTRTRPGTAAAALDLTDAERVVGTR